jgi:hypothetical protein
MDVLRELREVFSANGGWPVRVRDMGSRSSSSTLHTHLVQLERAGLIEKGPGKMGWRPRVDG